MSHSTAREIIERAMANRSVYDAMAARESEVWGRILPALEHSEARVEDARASAELRVSRHQASLTQVAKEKGLRFERGVTLGCGAGRLERALLESGICQSFHGIDISEKAIADARETAKLEGLSITYEVGDLNFLELPPKEFDLVVAQTSLHHVLFLEHVAEQAWRTLKDGGYLWIHDFIGETQGQYNPKRLSIMNEILSVLPEKFRVNRINNKTVTEIKTPIPGHLGSPFEKIRSEEIVPVFEGYFTIEWKREFTALLHLIAPPGTRAAYVENADTKALFEILLMLDQLCIQEGIVKPTGGQYLMRPRADRSA
jgi:ubiquinone/menaquinone biosynthesis C-methylase UbiE